jgi:hypothetical protein
MDAGFYSTITDLAKLGSAGVGLAVFLMAFFLIVRGKPVDDATARLREKFLVWGVGFAIFCGATALIAPWFEKDKPGGPVHLRLAFSPDFESESLSNPKIRLPDGSLGKPEEQFAVAPSDVTQVVTIGMDSALKEVKSLRQSTAALVQTVDDVRDQRDRLAATVPASAAPADARRTLGASSDQSEAIQNQVAHSIKVGDFDRAAVLSTQLRSSVARSGVAVDRIARPVRSQ